MHYVWKCFIVPPTFCCSECCPLICCLNYFCCLKCVSVGGVVVVDSVVVVMVVVMALMLVMLLGRSRDGVGFGGVVVAVVFVALRWLCW